ncbi:MAG: N-acetylmuramoyl-L-alanine amidase, partial [Ginsengibacter sp.]
MIVFAWYLLKVLIVSGILCGYYFIALKDKIFHKWNRFYLLFTIALSLLLPFVSINLLQPATEQGTVIKVLQAVTVQDEIVIELGKKSLLTTDTLIIAGYTLISLTLIATLLLTFLRIYRIKKRYPGTEVEGINFINTDAKGTPFSFFNSIFWNRSIDLHSISGQQIFNHEIAHVKEKHSYDKIFVNIILLFFWANPFFWIIRKELNMIHEFIADKAALEDGDVNAFAEMILSSVYPGQQLSITNNFFYSPVKRRLLMLLKNKNPKVNYLSRLLVLPLAAIVFMAFAIKMKTAKPVIYNGDAITVVIDAGHGGNDEGAISNDFKEKDLTLAIAKEIKSLNGNDKINIILTRDNDQWASVKDKASFANSVKADLFISIHADVEMNKGNHSGMSIFIPKNEHAYLNQSKLLGSSIIHSFKGNYPFSIVTKLLQRQIGVWVLSAVNCPSILIETGYISTPKDVAYLSKLSNQRTIAENILNGIENYIAQVKNPTVEQKSSIGDTSIPKMTYKNKRVTSLEVRPGKKNISVTYDDGSTEIIDKAEADKRGFVLPPPPPPPAPPVNIPPPPPPAFSMSKLPENALYELDGKEVNRKSIEALDPNDIESIEVFKGEQAVKLYGKKGANGVIKINKKSATRYSVTQDDTTVLIADKFVIGSEVRGDGTMKNPLIILEGKEISKAEMNQIPPGSIASINVIKGKAAIEKYGRKAEDGVIEIINKRVDGQQLIIDDIPNMV